MDDVTLETHSTEEIVADELSVEELSEDLAKR
jgi:hypothetical protein